MAGRVWNWLGTIGKLLCCSGVRWRAWVGVGGLI